MLHSNAQYVDNEGGESSAIDHLTSTFDGWKVNLTASLRLKSSDYYQIRDVKLPAGDGATKIDRIVVSQYGIFVIETMNMKGDVFGGKDQKLWIQQTQKGRHAFQNPMYRVYRRAKILVAMLGIDAHKVFPVVVFMGGAAFKAPMPVNVVPSSGYVRYIKSKSIPIMTKSEMARIVQKIKVSQSDHLMKSGAEQARPIRMIPKARMTAKTCPSCGNSMSLRVAKKGDQAGKRFWVCSDFPKCWEAIEAK